MLLLHKKRELLHYKFVDEKRSGSKAAVIEHSLMFVLSIRVLVSLRWRSRRFSSAAFRQPSQFSARFSHSVRLWPVLLC